jgi:hypothetical protein
MKQHGAGHDALPKTGTGKIDRPGGDADVAVCAVAYCNRHRPRKRAIE